MSFSLMPIELNQQIVDFTIIDAEPHSTNNQEIKTYANAIRNIALISQDFNNICNQQLQNIKKTYYRINRMN